MREEEERRRREEEEREGGEERGGVMNVIKLQLFTVLKGIVQHL